MVKQLALDIISQLPENATFDDIIEALYIRLKAQQGIEDVNKGKTMSTEQLRKELNL